MTAADQQHLVRVREDIRRLADEIGERNVYRYEQLAAEERLIEHWLREAGYAPARQEYEALGKRFANLEAERRGATAPGEVVIVGAHYDTGRGSPGANDNGSGVAALLALARAFVHEPVGRTLRFVAFTNEERPLLRTRKMGSRVYAMRCRERGENVVGMVCLETIAYRSQSPWSQRLSSSSSWRRGVATSSPSSATDARGRSRATPRHPSGGARVPCEMSRCRRTSRGRGVRTTGRSGKRDTPR